MNPPGAKGRIAASMELFWAGWETLLFGHQGQLRSLRQGIEEKAALTRGEPLPVEVRSQLGNGRKYQGIYASVAAALGSDKHTVRAVGLGKRYAPYILDALHKEVARIDESFPALPPPIAPSTWPEFKSGGKYYGIMSSVARQCGTRVENVHKCVYGERRTNHILRTLHSEMARMNDVPRPHAPPIPVSRRPEFLRGGRYYGVISSVARLYKISHTAVSKCVHGKQATPRLLLALHAEMGRVDDELAAKQGGAL